MSVTIQSRECIHATVKASTLLLGIGKGDEGKVYLVDFGLACRHTQNGKQKQYKEDLGNALPEVEGGTHPCLMPTLRQHLATPVHFRETSPAAKLQGVVHVFSSPMQLLKTKKSVHVIEASVDFNFLGHLFFLLRLDEKCLGDHFACIDYAVCFFR
ncbi:hypothetical protein MTO96_024945 [Rhipicephalus appendiculatus]